jgi:D-tyrosyl-tRNA(Tyr) deacylase
MNKVDHGDEVVNQHYLPNHDEDQTTDQKIMHKTTKSVKFAEDVIVDPEAARENERNLLKGKS